MTTSTTIIDGDVDPESPLNTTLLTRLRDNPIAQGEGDSTVPAVQRNIKHLIEAQTASASTEIDFDNVIDGTYDLYEVELINVIPSTNANSLLAPIQTGGSTWRTGSVYTNNIAVNTQAQLAAAITNVAADGGVSGSLFIPKPSSTSANASMKSSLAYMSSTTGFLVVDDRPTMYEGTSAMTGIRFIMGSGNIASGEFRLYGISA